MKEIYKIGTKQYFTYTPIKFLNIKFLKKIFKPEEHWVIRNVKYIYANNKDEAIKKYKKWFFQEYKAITKGWGNWYLESDGVDIFMDERCISITSTEIVFNENENINVDLEVLKENMQAENFKEWWHDGKTNI